LYSTREGRLTADTGRVGSGRRLDKIRPRIDHVSPRLDGVNSGLDHFGNRRELIAFY
jgi:hypothetical protein